MPIYCYSSGRRKLFINNFGCFCQGAGMPAVKCSSEVVEIKKLTYDVKEISLKLIDPPKVDFIAGQYISIEVTEMKDGHARLNNRPYSIVSPPEEDQVLKLCVNLVSGGPGSGYLHGLNPGDKVTFLYPMGYFTVHDEATTALLFVATGTGIAPIKSMILHLLRSGSARPGARGGGRRGGGGRGGRGGGAARAAGGPGGGGGGTRARPAPGGRGR